MSSCTDSKQALGLVAHRWLPVGLCYAVLEHEKPLPAATAAVTAAAVTNRGGQTKIEAAGHTPHQAGLHSRTAGTLQSTRTTGQQSLWQKLEAVACQAVQL